MTQPDSPLGRPEITEGMRAAAKAQPGGWLYSIDPMFDPNGNVPAFAIRGAFAVDERGEIGVFEANASYRPSPRALKLSPPGNALERALELAATGYGPEEDVLRALLDAELHLIERPEHPGQFAVAQEGEDQVLHVFTSESRRPGNWSTWQRARGRDLLGLTGVLLRLNPGVPAVASVTIPVADLAASAKESGTSTAADRQPPPDGVRHQEYVVWNSRLFPARRTAVDHRLAPHVSLDPGSGKAEPMLLSLVEASFTHTAVAHGTDATLYEVLTDHGNELELRAEAEGQPSFTMPLSEFERISQVRFDHLPKFDVLTASPPHVLLPMSPPEHPGPDALVDEITALLVAHAPADWHQISVQCHALATWQELTTTVRTAAGTERHWLPPTMLGQWFRRLRLATYVYPHGTWFTARYELARGELPKLAFDARNEPRWVRYFSGPIDLAARALREELLFFPRTPQTTPDWLAAAMSKLSLTGLPKSAVAQAQPPVNRETHLARTFDGMDEQNKPVLFRSHVVPGEKQALLDYLASAPVVLSSRGLAPDLLHPEQPQQVPMAYHTDGRWVWSSSVTYYLEHHDVAPDQAFLAHIRERGHQVPARLSSAVRARALAVATDAAELEPGLRSEFDQAAKALHGVVEHLAIDPRNYSLDSVTEGALCLVRDEDHYVVFWLHDGEKRFYAEFDSPGDAATYLIGFFYSYAGSLQRAAQ